MFLGFFLLQEVKQKIIYTSKDIKYLTNVIKFADPLTQGFYLKKFENQITIVYKYIGHFKCFIRAVTRI